MATIIFQHCDECGSDRFGVILRDLGHRLDVRNLHRGDPVPDDLTGVDAVVSCGGVGAPTDDRPWLDAEKAFLRAAHESDIPVVGFCLGSQILAHALGGETSPLAGGEEFGWHTVSLTPAGRDDPVYAGMAWDSIQLHAHSLHVTTPPDGARVLARSDRTPVQAWAVGQRTYAFQYHPEANADRAAQWAARDPKSLAASGQSLTAFESQTQKHWPEMARLSDRLFERLALCVMPLDRRFAGIAKDIHH